MKKANSTVPTIDEVIANLKSVVSPIDDVDNNKETDNEKAAIVLAVDDDDILLFGVGTIGMQANLIAALLKRQPLLMLALMKCLH